MLYNSLVLPNLTYGILTWGNNTNRLFKQQKKAVRIITNSKYNAHSEPLFKDLEYLKIADIYKLGILKFYFKYMKNQLPCKLQNIPFQKRSDIHSYNTRAQNKLTLYKTKHKFMNYSLRYQLPYLINNTSQAILEKIDTHSFQGFSWYIKHYYILSYDDHCRIDHCYICQSNNAA